MDAAMARFTLAHHGDMQGWQTALSQLPAATSAELFDAASVTLKLELADPAHADQMLASLQALHPWRKGPWQIGPIHIDTEWRSDWKWNRLKPIVTSLAGSRILDIGCGNGYFGWRMLAAGASEVVGIDPTLVFCMQHQAVQRYARHPRHWVLPLRIEELPLTRQFDHVFSMGVLYHRRDPLEHINSLVALTELGGMLVLETLLVDGPDSLRPNDRYARMRNVWCLPTADQIIDWLEQAGCGDITIIDVSPTLVAEQRSTAWMRFESLAEALDPTDSKRTVEGHPAPLRGIFVARPHAAK